jgi:hypothetical protein
MTGLGGLDWPLSKYNCRGQYINRAGFFVVYFHVYHVTEMYGIP